MKRDLLTLFDFTGKEISGILDKASELKKTRNGRQSSAYSGCTAAMFFEKPSLRTRMTFHTAAYELDGNSIDLSPSSIKVGERENLEDVARNIERWAHLIIGRTFSHETLVGFAENSKIPVINALSDLYHPCQALAFAMTLQEQSKKTGKKRVVFVGAGNNVAVSIMVYCAKKGYDFILNAPEGYHPPKEIMDRCRDEASGTGASVDIVTDPKKALKGADAVYTDVWTSMGQESEKETRARVFKKYQVNRSLMDYADKDALFSHCLPAHRGEEVTEDVIDGDCSIVFDEAENRLHVQKAAILFLMNHYGV